MSQEKAALNGTPPPHGKVADALRGRIAAGELLAGAKLDSQQHLAAEFEVSRGAVRKALEILKGERLIEDRGRGTPPTVAQRAAAARPAELVLSERVYAAFAAEHVTIDTFSYTTETLKEAVAKPKLAITEGILQPSSVTLRILLPSPSMRLAIPRLVGDASDLRPSRRMQSLALTHAASLKGSLDSLAERGLVPRVSVEARTVELTPQWKLYVLNGIESVEGAYPLVERDVDYDGETLLTYDVPGLDTSLFCYRADDPGPDGQGKAKTDEASRWFSSYWDTIAQPIDLNR